MSAFKSDHQLIRDYVTAMDHLQYTNLPENVVAINLTHSNLSAQHLDIRLDLHSKIGDIKEKFRSHIGTPVDHQRLILKNNGQVICEMSDNSKKLGFYSVQSGMEIHVIDTDPFSLSRGGGLTDTSLVQKYKMNDEDYDKRKGTMREYIREQKKLNPNFKLVPSKPKNEESGPPPGPESVEGISVGSRCEVKPGARRGTVKFVGEIEQIKAGGYWVGVQFDEPVGQNDGSIKGIKIFDCPTGFGSFVRGTNVTVGDFPELDPFASDDEGGQGEQDTKLSGAEEEDEDEI